ncbi:MAG: hypothetical protein AAB110_03870, partial [Candidatus Desantisbacteria bacterium]
MTIMVQDLIDRVIERTKQEIISHEQHEKALKQEKITESEIEMEVSKQPEPEMVVEVERQEEQEEIETIEQDYEIQGIEEGGIAIGVVEKID